jgi:hypothetical protein
MRSSLAASPVQASLHRHWRLLAAGVLAAIAHAWLLADYLA